jgi:hypothetical protein
MDVFGGLLIAGVGLFPIYWATKGWKFVRNDSKVRFLCRLLTPTGTRLFYILLGGFLVVFGILVTVGLIRK